MEHGARGPRPGHLPWRSRGGNNVTQGAHHGWGINFVFAPLDQAKEVGTNHARTTTHEAVRYPPLDHGTQPVHIFQLVGNRRLAFFFFIAEAFLLPLAKESCRQFQHRTTKIARRGSNFCQLACLASQEEGRGKLGGSPTWYMKWIPLPRLRPPGPGVPSSPPSPRMDWAAHMSTHQQPKVQCSFLVPMRTPESITIAAAEASNDSGWHTCLQDSCAEAKAEKRSRELGLRQ